MATVIEHEHTQGTGGDSGMGTLLGIIMLLIVAVLFFVYGLPLVANSLQGPQVNVPGKIDINVQNPK